MMADRVSVRRPRGWALLGALALSMAASGALAQGPTGGPRPNGPPEGAPPLGAPPGVPPGGPPGALPGGPPPGGLPGGLPGAPPGPKLTPAQALVESMGPATNGISFPIPVPLPDSPRPSANPRDFQGVWIHNQLLEFRMARDMYGELAPYTMKGAEVLVRRIKGDKAGKPYTNLSAKCRPPGPPWQLDLNFPFTIFQSKDWIEFVFEEYHGRWQIVLNPAAAPAPAEKSYMGRSVGHWDGNTLVVETKDFKQAIWLDVAGTPLSADGKLTQRIRRVENGTLQPLIEIVTTIDDPIYYTNPWSVVRSFNWNPNLAVHKEYNCEEQIGDRSVDADAGLVPEPKD